MKEKWNLILYLLWFSYLILSALIMFGHGFLLSRKTLSDISDCLPLKNLSCHGREENSYVKPTCTDDDKIRHILSNPGAPLVCANNRNRVMLILIDALRYDFTEYDPYIGKPLPYQNRLPVISDTLKKWPERTRLFRFVADPPTTTFQRVKALVTGSLPTFIDATSNFAAMELQEDNIISQVTNNGGKVVLLGDDTWERLIPGKWLRSFALYSFHTWDLDTVDMEIDSKIYDEMIKDDWDLMIAHYLGVDHAGHRYGPNHSEMSRKLDETNKRLRKFIENLPADVMLYVIGDHGMTETGDHGGESKAERTAAFFAYASAGLSNVWNKDTGKEVQQTDFAPTLCAALGRPPPSPSLGNVLTPVLRPTSVPQTLLLLSNNLKQMAQYLIRYGEESQQVSLDKLTFYINATRDQIQKAVVVETEDDLNKYIDEVRLLIDNTRSVFREVWVEFDSLSMLRALLLLVLAIFFNWLIAEGIPMERLPLIFASSFVPSGLISIAVSIAMCYTGFYLKFIEDLEHAITLTVGLVSGAMTCALVIMHWDGITQRWHDGQSQFYERFSRAALMASAVALVSNSYIIEEGASLLYLSLTILALITWNIGSIKAFGLLLCTAVVMALTRNYRGCREEQGDCWTNGSNAPTGQASRAALVLALGSMATVVAVARRQVGWRGHGMVVIGLLTCAHWAVGWGSLGSPGRSRQLARIVWFALGVMFISLWKKEGRGATLPLTVCGLLLYMANAMVLGAAYAPPAALALSTGFLALNIISLSKNSKFSITSRCSSSVACLWALLASYQFYGTGHHATLGHIRWAPAFHAGDSNYLPYELGSLITAILVSLEVFGMPLLFGATVPLLALWGRNGASTVGPRTQMTAVFSLCLKFSLCFAIRAFLSAISATIHCRHLMIWGVFTPKFLFEGASCAAALLGVVLGATLTAWHLPSQQRPS